MTLTFHPPEVLRLQVQSISPPILIVHIAHWQTSNFTALPMSSKYAAGILTIFNENEEHVAFKVQSKAIYAKVRPKRRFMDVLLKRFR